MDPLKEITPSKFNEDMNLGDKTPKSPEFFKFDSSFQPVRMCDLPGVKELFMDKKKREDKKEETFKFKPVRLDDDPVIIKLREEIQSEKKSVKKNTITSTRKHVATKLYNKFEQPAPKNIQPPAARKSYLPPKSRMSVMTKRPDVQKNIKTPQVKPQKETFIKPTISKIFPQKTKISNPTPKIDSDQNLKNLLLEIKEKICRLETKVDNICDVLNITKRDDKIFSRLSNDEMLDGICKMENTIANIEEGNDNSVEIKNNLIISKTEEKNKTLDNSLNNSSSKQKVSSCSKQNEINKNQNDSRRKSKLPERKSYSGTKIKPNENIIEKENIDPEIIIKTPEKLVNVNKIEKIDFPIDLGCDNDNLKTNEIPQTVPDDTDNKVEDTNFNETVNFQYLENFITDVKNDAADFPYLHFSTKKINQTLTTPGNSVVQSKVSTPENLEEFELFLQTPLPNIEETFFNLYGKDFVSSNEKVQQKSQRCKSLFKTPSQTTNNFEMTFPSAINCDLTNDRRKSLSLNDITVSIQDEMKSDAQQSTPDILQKTLNSYNALRTNNFLCTPKANFGSSEALMTPSAKLSHKKFISRKIQQQLYMLNNF